MNAWPRVRLDECTEVVSGATPDTSEAGYWDGDICWATPKDLSELEGAYISDTPRKITRRGLESCAASVLPPESVLFSSRAPIGHVAINTVPMATNQGFKSFVPDRQRVTPKFLYYWLRKNRPYLESLGNGATFKEVSKAVVSRIEIALPPIPEQQRIAAILDKADALRTKRRAALTQLDTLTRSIFLDMFGDPATNPKGWPISCVGAVAEQIRGVTYAGEEASAEPRAGYLPVLRAGNIASGEIVLDDLVHVPASRVAGGQLLRENDILIAASSGSLDVVGKAARLDCDLEMGFGAFCKVLRPSAKVNPDYFAAFFGTQYYRRRVSELAAGVNINNLRNEHLDQFPLPLPPAERQAEFSEVAAVLRIHRAHLRESSGALESLFVSLQNRAFRGEL